MRIGICSEVREVSVICNNPKLLIRQVFQDPDRMQETWQYQHEIIKLRPKDDDIDYFLDLTGAQYGYSEPVTPAAKYQESRVEEFVKERRFGTAHYFSVDKRTRARRKLQFWKDDDRWEFSNILYKCESVVKNGIKNWEKDNGMPLKSMVRLPKNVFEPKKTQLVQYIDDLVRVYLEFLTFEFRTYNGVISAQNTPFHCATDWNLLRSPVFNKFGDVRRFLNGKTQKGA